MTEKERESSERKKTLKKTSENNCPHIINMKLGKHLTLCKECGTMIYTEKVLKYTFKKHLVKPINYCKGNDVSPLKILDSLMENLKENKSIFPSFYSNIRLKLINMIIYLNKKFNGSLTTLYLSISFLDRIFSTFNFIDSKEEKKINLITISCYVIAYKYYEIDNYLNHLDFSFFQYKYNISRLELFEYEVLCLKKLDYNLQEVDSFSFLKVFMYIGFVLNTEEINISLNKLYRKIIHLFDSALLKEKILKKFSKVEIAFSIIYLIREKYGFSGKIFKEEILKKFYHFEFSYFEKCVNYIRKVFGFTNMDSYEITEKEKSERTKSEKKNSESDKNSQREDEEEKKLENYGYIKTERKRNKSRKSFYLLNNTSLSSEKNQSNIIKHKNSSYLFNPFISNNYLKTNIEVNKEEETPFLDLRNEGYLNYLVSYKNLDKIKSLIKAQKDKIENRKNDEYENEKNDENNYIIKPKKRLTVNLSKQGNALQLEKLRINELKKYLLHPNQSSKKLSVELNRKHFRYNSSIENSMDSSNFLRYNSLIENSGEKNSRNNYNSTLFNKPLYSQRSDVKKEKNKRFILSKNIKKDPIIFPIISN